MKLLEISSPWKPKPGDKTYRVTSSKYKTYIDVPARDEEEAQARAAYGDASAAFKRSPANEITVKVLRESNEKKRPPKKMTPAQQQEFSRRTSDAIQNYDRREEKPVLYKTRYICRVGDMYRVKAKPDDSYALHHGSFDSIADAKEFIDGHEKTDGAKIKNPRTKKEA